jgi:hypothetical protein
MKGSTEGGWEEQNIPPPPTGDMSTHMKIVYRNIENK